MPNHSISCHEWNPTELVALRSTLLKWFEEVSVPRRQMPWRVIKKNDSQIARQDHAYKTWISEIMLQQTQVTTVIPYFEAWIKKYPTIQDLANSTQEQVHQMWKGLGYYSRATRIHEAAKKVFEMGNFPDNSKELQKLPGIGLYTANAIASIVFDEPVASIDGNFVRVLSRLRAIHASPANANSKKKVTDFYNQLGDELVKADGGGNPGWLNQAVFDLGATVCTSSKPKCDECPVSQWCMALKESKNPEIEECDMCLPGEKIPNWITRYPPKPVKKEKKQEEFNVYIVECQNSFLLQKRETKGLLAGLWQFPMMAKEDVSLNATKVGQIKHVFSHVVWTLDVFYVKLEQQSFELTNSTWVSYEHLQKEAMSTAFVKCWDLAREEGKVSGQIASSEESNKRKR